MERFADLELDDAPPEGNDSDAPELGSYRWSHPDVDGLSVEAFDSFEEGRQMNDFVLLEGEKAGPATRALVAAGLHYPVVLEPLAPATPGREIHGLDHWRAVVDTKTGNMLGRPVGQNYHMAQNSTIAAMLDAFLPNDATVSIRSLRGGEKVVYQAQLGNNHVTDDQRRYIEQTRHRFHVDSHGWQNREDFVPPSRNDLTIVNHHGASGKLSGDLMFTFLACDNGYVAQGSSCGFRWTHTAYLDERIQLAQRAFERAEFFE